MASNKASLRWLSCGPSLTPRVYSICVCRSSVLFVKQEMHLLPYSRSPHASMTTQKYILVSIALFSWDLNCCLHFTEATATRTQTIHALDECLSTTRRHRKTLHKYSSSLAQSIFVLIGTPSISALRSSKSSAAYSPGT